MDGVYLTNERLKIDTPTITKLVATYPSHEYGLKIHKTREDHWYTKKSLSCWYRDLETLAGHAFLNTFGLKDKRAKKQSNIDVLDVIAQVLPEEEENRVQRLLNANRPSEVRTILERHHSVNATGERH